MWLLLLIPAAFLLMPRNAGGSSTMNDPFFKYDGLIRKYSAQYNVPWRWIKAVMMNESSLGQAPSVARGLASPQDIEASKSSDGKSWGLMQLTLPTAREFAPLLTAAGLNSPEISVKVGSQYLAKLMKMKGGDREATIRSYNGGPGYLNTAAGKRDTPVYYQRFLRNLAEIQTKQPGPELEIG